jgi:nucleotide-binding universal stress UspA family protein
MIALKHVLVATDFSEASDAALEYGRQFARMFGATLHVMHVVENVMARFAADAYPVLLPDLQREVEDSGEKRLMGVLTSEDHGQLHATPVVRTSTSPAAAIVEYSKEAGIDLIIMGTHGRGAVAKLLMGSVAERVVRTAACPVLTVRHPEHDFIVPDALVATSTKA